MKRLLILVFGVIIFCGTNASKVQLYLGIRGGAGVTINHYHFPDMVTSQGITTVKGNSYAWTAHAKGEVLFGVWRFRIGYRFLYNFSAPLLFSGPSSPIVDGNRYTTYFNSSQTHYFGHYLVLELAVINRQHFGLVPGVAVGTYGGYRVDNTTEEKVRLGVDTYHRFSVGLELNFEIKFGRCVFLAGPNYYLFSMQDRADNNWHNYQHILGADVGLRVNLLKP